MDLENIIIQTLIEYQSIDNLKNGEYVTGVKKIYFGELAAMVVKKYNDIHNVVVPKDVYVIKDTEAKDENCYVDIDRSSGGYPFLRPLIDAHKFSKKSAIEYMKTYYREKWVLQKFTCYATDCAEKELNDLKEDKI